MWTFAYIAHYILKLTNASHRAREKSQRLRWWYRKSWVTKLYHFSIRCVLPLRRLVGIRAHKLPRYLSRYNQTPRRTDWLYTTSEVDGNINHLQELHRRRKKLKEE